MVGSFALRLRRCGLGWVLGIGICAWSPHTLAGTVSRENPWSVGFQLGHGLGVHGHYLGAPGGGAIQASVGPLFTVSGDYQWLFDDQFRWLDLSQSDSWESMVGRLVPYLAAGIETSPFLHSELVGFRAPVGVQYFFPRHPVSLFLSVIPILFAPVPILGLTWCAGVRVNLGS